MPQWIGSPFRDHFVYMPSQWEIMLHCNVVSHWPGAYLKWSLHHCFRFWFVPTTWNNADSLLSKRCFGSNLSKIWIKIKICMKENAFKDAICKMLTILFRPQQVMKLGCPGCQEASANIMLTQVWFPFYSCLAYHILCQQWFHCWQYSLKKAPVCDSWFFSMSCSGRGWRWVAHIGLAPGKLPGMSWEAASPASPGNHRAPNRKQGALWDRRRPHSGPPLAPCDLAASSMDGTSPGQFLTLHRGQTSSNFGEAWADGLWPT